MPYIVTTKRPFEWDGKTLWTVSRFAVATLEKAKRIASRNMRRAVNHDLIDDEAWAAALAEVASLPESGGTITLPDETEIEVRQRDWETVADDADLPRLIGLAWRGLVAHADDGDETAQRAICDAYNARRS